MASLGSLQDNQKNSFKIVDDGGSSEVGQRVYVSGSAVSLDGTTASYSGSATTSPSLVPAVAGNAIKEILLKNESSSIAVLVSLDGGSTYFSIPAERTLSVDPVRGDITQVLVKTLSGTASYSSIIGCV